MRQSFLENHSASSEARIWEEFNAPKTYRRKTDFLMLGIR